MSSIPMATVVSNDGFEIQASLLAVKQSITLGTMLELLDEDQTTDLPIPVPEVDGETLQKITEWCEYHREDSISEQDKQQKTPEGKRKKVRASRWNIPKWDADFLASVDNNSLLKLANAANYLEIPILLQYTIYKIAQKLVGMSTQEMREFLNIQNDFSAEEEASIRAANAWAIPPRAIRAERAEHLVRDPNA
ncbi:s-phase kinase-associated protein 1 [Xylaria sp. FL1777]|nr:s-phase kinase-associated protein 1 [Xylaria sp. FL1777]